MLKPLNFKVHLTVLLFIQIALFFLYGYHKMYNNRPYSIHQWRQTDCLSFTKNYYEEGMNFLSPKIHWQGVKEGKTISEFPLINYTVACLWKVFGEHEYIYRFTILFLFFTSLCFLFTVIYYYSESLLYSYFGTTLISTSPVLAYYSFSFLADVPALSFAIISLSLFFVFLNKKKTSLFYLALLCGTIAVLIKASSASVLLIIGTISLINIFDFPKSATKNQKLFNTKLMPIISLVVSFLIILLWYKFAFLYNNKNSNGVFLMETLPIWKMKDKVIETARLLYNVQLEMFLNKGVLIGLLLALIWLLLNLKKLNYAFVIAIVLSTISFVAFIILFYQVFNVHDYYLINNMMLPVVIIISFGNYLKNNGFNFSDKKVTILACIVFIFNSTYCAAIIRLRNIPQDVLCKYYPFITNEEKNFFDWFHYNYENTLKPLETITPELRRLGIKRDDIVLSFPDPSFNITLYLMDQKGYTATSESLKTDSAFIQNYKNNGVKYLIINDINAFNDLHVNETSYTAVGSYKTITILKVN